MEEVTLHSEDGKSLLKGFSPGDIEMVDPVAYYKDYEIRKSIVLNRLMLNMRDPIMTAFISKEWFQKKAEEDWEKRLKLINSAQVPENFITLLETRDKKEQIRLLKGQSITPFQLAAYIFRAYNEFGYLFSNYLAEHHHKGVDTTKLPEGITVKEDGSVKSFGATELTDGQLKNIVTQRRVVVAKVLDRENEWHCFFLTYKSLRGEESWKDGQPHFHYISDQWGISRKDAIEQLKGEKYPSTSVHIDLKEYREP